MSAVVKYPRGPAVRQRLSTVKVLKYESMIVSSLPLFFFSCVCFFACDDWFRIPKSCRLTDLDTFTKNMHRQSTIQLAYQWPSIDQTDGMLVSHGCVTMSRIFRQGCEIQFVLCTLYKVFAKLTYAMVAFCVRLYSYDFPSIRLCHMASRPVKEVHVPW